MTMTASHVATSGGLRAALALTSLATAALAFVPAVLAQNAYPSKVVRVILPFPAGSPPDVTARLLSDRLSKATGQSFIVDNRAGASTLIGTQAAVNAPADGYTLLSTVSTTTSINPYIFKSLPYRVEELIPISQINSVPFVLVVGEKSPYRSPWELINAAKASPGKLNYASYGIGQATHVAFANFLGMSGTSMTHVPYKDGGIADLISGTIDASFEPIITALPMVQGRKLRALAVSTPSRQGVLPDVPPLADSVSGFSMISWQGLFAPKGTPPEVIARLARLTQEAVNSEDFKAKLREQGVVSVGSNPDDFRRFMVEDAKVWEKVVKANDIRAD